MRQKLIKRITIIVMDSVGIGELPDAADYGDKGSNTLANCARAVGGLKVPNLGRFGLGNIHEIMGVPPVKNPLGAYGKMAEKSPGKDTTTGHWEIAGLILSSPFPVYPNGFPNELIQAFQRAIGRKVLGNKPASGTRIIEELGQEHIESGCPIVYTSADSVFQIAAHEEVIPLEELYSMCKKARELLIGEHAVGRVIARPFIGKAGNFQRTTNRKDFSVKPPAPTVLDLLTSNGYEVTAIGKIGEIFACQGITRSIPAKGNMNGVEHTLSAMRENNSRGVIFTNLVDFDSLYGHRNNPRGYADALEEFDARIPDIMQAVRSDELLILTADHGCDPTTEGTDHSREYVPLLVYGNHVKAGRNLGIRDTFADIAATVADIFDLPLSTGKSFVGEILF